MDLNKVRLLEWDLFGLSTSSFKRDGMGERLLSSNPIKVNII